jgi:hypothetical protein
VLTPEEEDAVLHDVDFDADSKGDCGRILDVRMVTAAKLHKGVCTPCGGDIQKGERHRVERGLYDGKVGNCRTCAECCKILSKWCSPHDKDQDAIEARYTLGRQRAEEKHRG